MGPVTLFLVVGFLPEFVSRGLSANNPRRWRALKNTPFLCSGRSQFCSKGLGPWRKHPVPIGAFSGPGPIFELEAVFFFSRRPPSPEKFFPSQGQRYAWTSGGIGALSGRPLCWGGRQAI